MLEVVIIIFISVIYKLTMAKSRLVFLVQLGNKGYLIFYLPTEYNDSTFTGQYSITKIKFNIIIKLCRIIFIS